MELDALIDVLNSKDIVDVEFGQQIFNGLSKEEQYKIFTKLNYKMGWRLSIPDEWTSPLPDNWTNLKKPINWEVKMKTNIETRMHRAGKPRVDESYDTIIELTIYK